MCVGVTSPLERWNQSLIVPREEEIHAIPLNRNDFLNCFGSLFIRK
jgi:hypothetical protein